MEMFFFHWLPFVREIHQSSVDSLHKVSMMWIFEVSSTAVEWKTEMVVNWNAMALTWCQCGNYKYCSICVTSTNIWTMIYTDMGFGKLCPLTSYSIGFLIDGLVHDCSDSNANALELLQSCTEPSIWVIASIPVALLVFNNPCISVHRYVDIGNYINHFGPLPIMSYR